MTKAEYLEENECCIEDENLPSLHACPDAAWDLIVAVGQKAFGSHSDDPGIDYAVAATQETLADFDRSRSEHWKERGHRVEGDGYIIYEGIQVAKGQRRVTMAVVDADDCRICLTY